MTSFSSYFPSRTVQVIESDIMDKFASPWAVSLSYLTYKYNSGCSSKFKFKILNISFPPNPQQSFQFKMLAKQLTEYVFVNCQMKHLCCCQICLGCLYKNVSLKVTCLPYFYQFLAIFYLIQSDVSLSCVVIICVVFWV